MKIEEAYNKIMSSDELKNKAIDAVKNNKVENFIKEQRLDVTVDQIKDYIKRKQKGELTKEELNMAAGGGCDDCGWSDPVFSIFTIGIGCAYSAALPAEDQEHIYDCEQ